MTESAMGRATVVFQRSAAETFFVVVLCYATVLLAGFALAVAAPPKTELRCDRAADQCTSAPQALAGPSLSGRGE